MDGTGRGYHREGHSGAVNEIQERGNSYTGQRVREHGRKWVDMVRFVLSHLVKEVIYSGIRGWVDIRNEGSSRGQWLRGISGEGSRIRVILEREVCGRDIHEGRGEGNGNWAEDTSASRESETDWALKSIREESASGTDVSIELALPGAFPIFKLARSGPGA